MTHRALVCALERLVPFYRERMVLMLARALADGRKKDRREYLGVLDADEIERAHRLAVDIRARRNGISFERRVASALAVAMRPVRRLGGFVRQIHNRLYLCL